MADFTDILLVIEISSGITHGYALTAIAIPEDENMKIINTKNFLLNFMATLASNNLISSTAGTLSSALQAKKTAKFSSP